MARLVLATEPIERGGARAAGAGPDPEIGKRWALPRSVNMGEAPRRADGVSGGLDREMRLIALFTQVKQDHVPQRAGP